MKYNFINCSDIWIFSFCEVNCTFFYYTLQRKGAFSFIKLMDFNTIVSKTQKQRHYIHSFDDLWARMHKAVLLIAVFLRHCNLLILHWKKGSANNLRLQCRSYALFFFLLKQKDNKKFFFL